MRKNQARNLGLLYLLMAVIAPFALLYVPSVIMVENDWAATGSNILANEGLFRAGIAVQTVTMVLEVILTSLLYRLFKPVNTKLAVIAAFSRLAMTIIQGVNIISYWLVIEFAANEATVSLLLRSHDFGTYIWQILFGLHLLVLGYLALKSEFVPSFIGVLIMVASFGYLAESYFAILALTSEMLASLTTILLIVSTIGESSFILWLLYKGFKPEKSVGT